MTQIWYDLITCESELHGWVSQTPCPMLGHLGTREATRMRMAYSRQAVINCFFCKSNGGKACLHDPIASRSKICLDHSVVKATLTV